MQMNLFPLGEIGERVEMVHSLLMKIHHLFIWEIFNLVGNRSQLITPD